MNGKLSRMFKDILVKDLQRITQLLESNIEVSLYFKLSKHRLAIIKYIESTYRDELAPEQDKENPKQRQRTPYV